MPINVRTRASGDSPLDITLQTPDGGMVIAKTRVTVRSTAFSGVGIVLLVGAGGFLALWWGRHILTAAGPPAVDPATLRRDGDLATCPLVANLTYSWPCESSPTAACDLTQDEADQLDIAIVPLSIRFGDEEFTDRVDLSVSEFYRRLSESEELPETAAPSPGAFEAAFRGPRPTPAPTPSCASTCHPSCPRRIQSAQTAAKSFDGTLDVRVVDSTIDHDGTRLAGDRGGRGGDTTARAPTRSSRWWKTWRRARWCSARSTPWRT